MRMTPDKITKLEPNEVFVFGSNLAGRHGKGAARDALKFGAVWGQGDGLMGQTYGISTKGSKLEIESLKAISIRVDKFLRYVKFMPPSWVWLVTPIGCGLAGYKPSQIAPMFKNASANVILPTCFLPYL